MWDLIVLVPDHCLSFLLFKKGSCQLLAKDWALNTGKLPRNSVTRLTDLT